MIDISDGLSRDLRHICRESRLGAMIHASVIPLHDDAIEIGRDGKSPLEHALHDGEDYELLFTSPHNNISLATRIGATTGEEQILLEKDRQLTPLEPLGWEHTF